MRESSLVLLDAFHEPELTREIESMIEMNSQIKEMKDLKLRRAGPFIVGILEVVVDGGMTVKQMHTVVTELENWIREENSRFEKPYGEGDTVFVTSSITVGSSKLAMHH